MIVIPNVDYLLAAVSTTCLCRYAEPTDELPVDNAETDKTVAAADAGEQSVSPIHRYVSYDERPLPAIRRSLLAVSFVSFVILFHSQFLQPSCMLGLSCLVC